MHAAGFPGHCQVSSCPSVLLSGLASRMMRLRGCSLEQGLQHDMRAGVLFGASQPLLQGFSA